MGNERAVAPAEGALRYRDLVLDPASFTAELCGRPLRLTKREFEILAFMLSSPPGRVFSRRELAACGLAGGFGGAEASVYVHIFYLRQKIRAVSGSPYIETSRTRGFFLPAGGAGGHHPGGV